MDSQRRDDNAGPVTGIQRLIRERKKQLDIGDSDIARASGGRLVRQTVQRIESKGLSQNPGEKTIKGFAAGLRVPERTVRDAIAETLGLRVIRDQHGVLQAWVDEAEERLTPAGQVTLGELIGPLIDMIAGQESKR